MFLCVGPPVGCCIPDRGLKWRETGTGVNLRVRGWSDVVAGAWGRTHPLHPPGCKCQTPDRCRCHPGAGTAERLWSCGVMQTLSWKHNPVSDLTPKNVKLKSSPWTIICDVQHMYMLTTPSTHSLPVGEPWSGHPWDPAAYSPYWWSHPMCWAHCLWRTVSLGLIACLWHL